MTVLTVNLPTLKRVKNSVIGNPSAKRALAQDQVFVQTLVECLNHPPPSDEPQGSRDDIRIEAAHVISSLSYGSQEALRSLLQANAIQAFLYAISNFQPKDPTPLRSAFARALRALAVAIAEAVGPSQWGLRAESPDIRNEAKAALDYLFQLEFLDIYLPLLSDASPQTSASIAQLLGSAVRSQVHRTAVTEWLPPAERIKEVKGKRGWEKPDSSKSNAPSRQGGWVARNLTASLRSRDGKLQEAALLAIAALAKYNQALATVLVKPSLDRDMSSPLSSVLSLTKSRSTDVQLAACLCATHIIRSTQPNHTHAISNEAMTVMHVVNRLIASSSDTPQVRTKACFILYFLISDDDELCRTAHTRGSLEKLAELLKSITSLEPSTEWDDEEPESISCLREAALTAVAAISLHDHDIRRDVTDTVALLPTIYASLSSSHVGVRYAASQCVRAISRSVSVLRTNLVDIGLGTKVFELFKKEDEDRRVVNACLSAVCNLMADFSPLRSPLLEQGLMPRLLQLFRSGDPTLRLSVLWCVKNLLRKSSTEIKRMVMDQFGWRQLEELLLDSDADLQEQAWTVVRNLAENELGIELIVVSLGVHALMNSLLIVLSSSNGMVLEQATCVLANLANGRESHQSIIMNHPQILTALRTVLAEAKVESRRPAASCILELVRADPKKMFKPLNEAGIVSTLRHICDWTGGIPINPGGRSGTHPHAMVVDDDQDVINQARLALEWLDNPGEAGY